MEFKPLDFLPVEILDQVLTSLPDFRSLRSAVTASRRLHEAYALRKKHILIDVEYNEVGPALRCAVALVRLMTIVERVRSESNFVNNEELEDIVNLLSKPDSYLWNPDLTAQEAFELTRVSSTVRRYESHYWLSYRGDSMSKRSLTDAESIVFHHAMYRLYILSVLSSVHSNHRELRLPYFQSLSVEELANLSCIFEFVEYITQLTLVRRESRLPHAIPPYAIFGFGPEAILRAFDTEVKLNWSLTYHYTQSIGTAYLELIHAWRVHAKNWQDERFRQPPNLLNTRKCDKCGENTMRRIGEINRDWAVLGAHNIMEHLPGYLIRNQSFVHECKKYFSSDKHASMFEDMLKSQNDPEGGWTSNQLLCPACLSIFIRENIVSWLVMQLIRDNYEFKENCWYGWNCRTQVNKLYHAQKLNHLCEPTSKDNSAVQPMIIGGGAWMWDTDSESELDDE